MHLMDLHLKNFRAFEERAFKFAPGMTLLVGENGSGKTTVLEAIHLLALTRSFRTTRYGELVRESTESYQARAKVKRGDDIFEIETNGLLDGSRRFLLGGAREKSFRDILGRLPVVSLVPEDIALIRGPDSERRAFMDRVLGTTDRTYLDALVNYRHVLRQRNAALRQSHSQKENAEIWNEPLAEYAAKLWRLRTVFGDQLGAMFSRLWKRYPLDLEVRMIYLTPAYAGRESYLAHLQQSMARDLQQGRTTCGPHRDRLSIEIGGRPARAFGSSGEQKMLLATLKLSEARYVHEKLGHPPVLLLDDLFATLDEQRAALLLGELSDDYQAILTTTRIEGPLEVAAQRPASEIINCSRETLWLA